MASRRYTVCFEDIFEISFTESKQIGGDFLNCVNKGRISDRCFISLNMICTCFVLFHNTLLVLGLLLLIVGCSQCLYLYIYLLPVKSNFKSMPIGEFLSLLLAMLMVYCLIWLLIRVGYMLLGYWSLLFYASSQIKESEYPSLHWT